VRKTACLCVAKLFDLNPELAVESGFVESLQEMVSDINPMVVANAVVALSDINEASPGQDVFRITGGMNALNGVKFPFSLHWQTIKQAISRRLKESAIEFFLGYNMRMEVSSSRQSKSL
jgi:hypothetical protein